MSVVSSHSAALWGRTFLAFIQTAFRFILFGMLFFWFVHSFVRSFLFHRKLVSASFGCVFFHSLWECVRDEDRFSKYRTEIAIYETPCHTNEMEWYSIRETHTSIHIKNGRFKYNLNSILSHALDARIQTQTNVAEACTLIQIHAHSKRIHAHTFNG